MVVINQQVFPTKGNLIATKKSLSLAQLGYDLLDRKRNILIHELMTLVDKVKALRERITSTFDRAYKALQMANLSMGLIEDITNGVPIENGITLSYRSVMGVEIPIVGMEGLDKSPELFYGVDYTNSRLDEAYICFDEVKKLTIVLAEVENSVYRLASAIRKTGRRANALKNIVIPQFKTTVKYISDALEEKEREEFSRLKVIKSNKDKKGAV